MSAREEHSTTNELLDDLERSGFYPPLVADAVDEALDSASIMSHLVHLETHIDRNEVHRHSTTLVLARDFLVVVHVDDHQMDESGTKVVAQIASEIVPLSKLGTVGLAATYQQPQHYRRSDMPQEVIVALSWSGGQRLDLMPANCPDPECTADHGYTGTMSREDISLRISAEAEGPQAVVDAKNFIKSLRRAMSWHSATGAAHAMGAERVKPHGAPWAPSSPGDTTAGAKHG